MLPEELLVQAMILAAGFGTRLLPHTQKRPKPLFPLLNEPLLLLTIKRLQRSGFDHIIVNCHHLKEQVVEVIDGIPGVVIQQEETILGTGGALRKALDVMHDEPLLVTNGDIYHTIDFKMMYQAQLHATCCATLGMHNYPRFNTVAVEGGRVVDFGKNPQSELLAFTGIHIITPQMLKGIPEGIQFCIVDHYRNLLANNEKIAVYRTDDCFWTDMGTPEDYLSLHQGLLTGDIPRWSDFMYQSDNPQLISDDAVISGDIDITGWCSIGNITAHNVKVSESVIWDGVELPDGLVCHNKVISSSDTLDESEVQTGISC